MLGQTFSDFELLVVDDGSEDATAAVVTDRHDPRLRFVRTGNRGVAAARNHGLELTSSDYVAFLDADDAWRPAKLERQYRTLTEQPSVGLCFTSAELVDDALRPLGLDVALDRPDYAEPLLLAGNIIAGGGSSVMARRSVIERVSGFDPDLSQCADWDLWLRLSLITRFAAISDPLVLYRSVPGTMSADPARLERDTFALLDKFFASPSSRQYQNLRRRAYANHWMICAGSYLHVGQLANSIRCLTHGLRNDPRTLGRPLALPARWIGRVARQREAQARAVDQVDGTRPSRRS